jgi:hypothetical protein
MAESSRMTLLRRFLWDLLKYSQHQIPLSLRWTNGSSWPLEVKLGNQPRRPVRRSQELETRFQWTLPERGPWPTESIPPAVVREIR